jgi:hypothetical protein
MRPRRLGGLPRCPCMLHLGGALDRNPTDLDEVAHSPILLLPETSQAFNDHASGCKIE